MFSHMEVGTPTEHPQNAAAMVLVLMVGGKELPGAVSTAFVGIQLFTTATPKQST